MKIASQVTNSRFSGSSTFMKSSELGTFLESEYVDNTFICFSRFHSELLSSRSDADRCHGIDFYVKETLAVGLEIENCLQVKMSTNYSKTKTTQFSCRKCGSSVVRHLPLVLEVPGSIPARGEKKIGVRTRFL